MSGFLFDDIVFGPVISRRLGVSLGINLLPLDQKLCSYNCIYCECGFNAQAEPHKVRLFSRVEIFNALDQSLKELKKQKITPDSITFAGNGEPTLHPEFSEIIDDTLNLRDKYFSNALVTVLSNSSTLDNEKVFTALLKTNNIMKLDSAVDSTFKLLNNLANSISVTKVIENLTKFEGKVVIQTMFLKGQFNDTIVDNTTDTEIKSWIGALKKIKPFSVMIYSIDRIPPVKTIEKITKIELEKIARLAENEGFKIKVY